jgi:hypothetical protein
MGTVTGGAKNIVTNGLVLYLDAANTKSYPGTGTTWFDLSGNNNHFTLYNGVDFSNNVMVFDGVNDYIQTTNNLNLTSTNAVTILYFIQVTTYGTAVKILHELSTNFNNRTDSFVAAFSDDSVGQNFEILASVKGDVGYNIASYNKTMLNDLLWHQHSVIHDTTQTTTEVLMYGNGQPGTIIQNPVTGYNSNNTNTFGNQPFYIGSRAGTSFFAPIRLGSVQMYNRALTATEILQNFNSSRARFGI